MKIARYLAHGQISYGAVEGDSVKELSASPFENYTITDHTHKLSEVKLLAPCIPTKILAIGLNYSSHLHDRPGPTEPMVFYKTPTSVIGPDETIIRPRTPLAWMPSASWWLSSRTPAATCQKPTLCSTCLATPAAMT